MTRVFMQPGEHDLVTDLIAALTFGLVDLTPEPDHPAAHRPATAGDRGREPSDRERE